MFRLAGLLALIVLLSACRPPQTNPNILILFLDDFGFGDIASQYPENAPQPPMVTPVLDAFLQTSLSFDRHYTESTCSPSRAALLSGRYPARFGYTPNGRGLPPEIITLPEALGAGGYTTRFLGKWHTGDLAELAFPHNQGFDSWLGFLNQWRLRSQYDPDQNNHEQPTYFDPWMQNQLGQFEQFEGHLTDILSSEAREFFQQQSSATQPWFLQVSFLAPHEPVQPAPRYQQKYANTAEGAYRALVEQLDSNIGEILDSLESNGMAENTIVVIVSDNGGTNARFNSNAPFVGDKASYSEGGVRTPLMIRWPNGDFAGVRYPYAVSLMDLYPTLLASVGIEYNASILDGRNLLPVLELEQRLERPLYWEAIVGDSYTFSVLDESHRWRYTTDLLGGQTLYDLENDPSGASGIPGATGQISDQLNDQYRSWHDEVHRIDTRFEALDSNGRGILTGDSLQRSPGLGEFTFAIGVTPGPEATTAGTQVIASQSQLFSMTYNNETLRVSLQDASLSAPLPADGQCHPVIVTAQQSARISWIMGTEPVNSPIDLIIDGAIVASLVDHREVPKIADLTAPTFIGYRPITVGTGNNFSGTLSAPVIYNHRVVPTPAHNQFGFTELINEICPPVQ